MPMLNPPPELVETAARTLFLWDTRNAVRMQSGADYPKSWLRADEHVREVYRELIRAGIDTINRLEAFVDSQPET